MTELITDKDLSEMDKIKTILALYSQFVPQDVSDALSHLMNSVESERVSSQPPPVIIQQSTPQQYINIKKTLTNSFLNPISILPSKPQIQQQQQQQSLPPPQQQNIKPQIQFNKSVQTEGTTYDVYDNKSHTDNEYLELQKTLKITRETLDNQDKTIKHFYKVLNINREIEEKKIEIMKKRNKYMKKSINNENVEEEEEENNNNKPPLYPDYDYNYLDEDNEGFVDDNEYIEET